MGSGTPLSFTLLGPLRGRRGDRELVLGGPQQRAVLAALLLAEGRSVTVAELIQGLWGDHAPKTAATIVRTYVSRLRAVLEVGSGVEGAPSVLSSYGSAYALRLPEGALDVALARRESETAVRARRDGDAELARRSFRQALARWQGSPLEGLPGPFAETWREHLTQWCLATLESAARADLECDDAWELSEWVRVLSAAAEANPLRESLWELLMRVLHRSGRTADALEVFHRARALLARELGIDPDRRLSELHERILRSDPGLTPRAPTASTVAAVQVVTTGVAVPGDAGSAPGGPASGGAEDSGPPPGRASLPRPAQLPADAMDFTGRREAVAELREVLLRPSGTAVRVCVVAGIGGAGKTALAVHVAHLVRAAFPDGQLFVDLHGAGERPTDPHQVLGGLLRALGVPHHTVPGATEERAALFRSTLAGRRVLLVLDDAADAAQVKPLLPGDPACAVIVTSRGRFGAVPAHSVELDAFSPDEARELLRSVIGPARVEAEAGAAEQLLSLCGHLPLAVRVVACRLSARPGTPLADCVGHLADERGRLGRLSTGDLDVESCFRIGYDQLDPALARTFRLLAVPDAVSLSLSSAAALLALDPYEAERRLDELVRRGLLQSPALGTYRFHDLLRLFARGRCEAVESGEAVHEALVRLLDDLLDRARAAYLLLRPGHGLAHRLGARTPAPADAGAAHGPYPAPFPTPQEAHAWFDRERGFLMRVMRQAAGGAPGLVERAAWLLLGLDPLLERGYAWPDIVDPGLELAAAAVRAGLPSAEAAVRYMLAGALWQLSRAEEASDHIHAAARLSHAQDEPLILAEALTVTALVAASRNGYAPDTVALLRQAAEIHQSTGNTSGEANTLGNLAAAHIALGQVAEAVRAGAAGLLLYRGLGDPMGEAQVLVHHGTARRMLGDFAAAQACYGRALTLAGMLGLRFVEAAVLVMVAETHLECGDAPAALTAAETARDLSRELGFARKEVTALTVLGRALALHGRRRDAIAVLGEAIDRSLPLGGLTAESRAAAQALASLRAGGGTRVPALPRPTS
ncbi:BTAD domain-containing putative transcriptional regulator [Streptomyces sp. NPDC058486]|uniref:AfsR/SARP family transcriptional regulator n=1 Tax=unclassified Streptomyces TaxID=2593676 RepID=UPI00364DEF03